MKPHVFYRVGWLLLALLLIVPVQLAYQTMAVDRAALWVVVGSSGWVLVFYALSGWLASRWLAALLVVVGSVLIGVRAINLGLVRFSGFGFTPEFFRHLERESVRVAWADYRLQVLSALLFLLVATGLLAVLLGRGSALLRRRSALGLLLLGLAGVVSARAVLPEWQLWRAWEDWREPAAATVGPATLAAWERAGILHTQVVDKSELSATAASPPKNLVLVYLESLGLAAIEHPRWPGLMPHLQRLLGAHRLVSHLETSAYITMEGIANSQCGTLLPFNRESDSLASGNRLFENLPCLGDVLAAARYRQIYLGGALSEFAGKGEFLGAHGYGDVRGFEYWREHGFAQRAESWGLSDVDLFEQATVELRRLQAEAGPFHLTLLTIGTHLPGFSYAECAPYQDGSRPFLNAMHCTDQLLAAWLDQAAGEGLFKNSVVVITADHHVFPSPLMRELFGDGVDDRRLPLVVIDPHQPTAAATHGASYDLAPTVLDLLGVSSNARFILGRSLLRPIKRPPWLFSRYFDVAPGTRLENNPASCHQLIDATSNPPGPPFDACGKKALIGALAGIADHHSLVPAQLSCTPTRPTRLAFVEDPAGPRFQALVGGVDQSERFSLDGYAVPPGSTGIYEFVFGRHGRLRRTRFVPEHGVGELIPEPAPEVTLLVRRPPAGAPAAVSAAAVATDAGSGGPADGIDLNQPGAWLLAAGRPAQTLAAQGGGWQLPDSLCRQVFWEHGEFTSR